MASLVLGELLHEASLPSAPSLSCPGSQWVAFLALLVASVNQRQSAERARRAEAAEHQHHPHLHHDTEYDLVIVGGGSSGCVLASRLSEGGRYRVLLLERGGSEPPQARVPGFAMANLGSDLVENIQTVADPRSCNGKGCAIQVPRVLGGGGAVNAMTYIRGSAQDYDDWADALNDTAWNWDNVLPYFKKLENNLDIAVNWDTDFHSASGPQKVSWQSYRSPALHRVALGLEGVGVEQLIEVNGRQGQLGYTVAQTFTADGERWSAYRSYVEPALDRPNLRVETFATARRVLLEKDADGTPRAAGVEYVDAAGQTRVVRARREVILTAGTIHTPQILIMSGIGPADHLKELGVPLRVDLPVGEGLMDHARVAGLVLSCDPSVCKVGWDQLAADLRRYALASDGPVSEGFGQLTSFHKLTADKDTGARQPDIQLLFASSTEVHGPEECQQPSSWRYNRIAIAPVLLHPESRGSVRLNASDPYGTPVVDLAYLTDAEGRDLETFVRALRLGVRIARQLEDQGMRLQRYPSAAQGCEREALPFTDAYLACLARRSTATVWHWSGTCAMGSVSDPSLRVRGVRGLRVADASALPSLPSGNINAPILMLAERVADLVREELVKGGGGAALSNVGSRRQGK